MIKNRKNKIILGALAGAAVISLASVGFAQWQIGLVKNQDDKTLHVDVDTYAEETCYINVTTEDNPSINLGELKAIDKRDGVSFTTVKQTKPSKLNIVINEFTLAISEKNVEKKPSLTFKLEVDANQTGKSLSTKIDASDKFVRGLGDKTFIGLKQDITLDTFTDNSCFDIDKSTVPGYSIFKLKTEKKNFTFNWGSLFGNVDGNNGIIADGNNTPSNFYQAKLDEVDKEESSTEEAKLIKKLGMLSQVQSDLDAMKTSLQDAKLKLTINFGFSE